MFLLVFDTFIKTDPFGSLTKNDATVGTKLFGPTRDLFYGVKVRFLKEYGPSVRPSVGTYDVGGP